MIKKVDKQLANRWALSAAVSADTMLYIHCTLCIITTDSAHRYKPFSTDYWAVQMT